MRLWLYFILAFVLVSCTKTSKKDFAIPINKSDAFITEFMTNQKVPGMSVAVSYKGKLIWSKGFGYANVELNVLVDPMSKFRIASVSKPITAALTAYLYQNGDIDIYAPVRAILDDFPTKRWSFNIRQLMSHAAGVRHYKADDTNFIQFHSNIKKGLEIIKYDSLLCKPGSKFSYSSYGYNIIGACIEKKTGRSFENILTDSLFVPLGMNNSVIDNPFSIISNRTSAYVLDENGYLENAPFHDNRYKIPAGGILSTAEDLVTFGVELLRGDYLTSESTNLLFSPFEYTNEESSDTGFGWIVTTDEQGNLLYGHLGGQTGGCSAIMIYPEKELIVVWLGNLDTDWSDIPTKTIANYFLDVLN